MNTMANQLSSSQITVRTNLRAGIGSGGKDYWERLDLSCPSACQAEFADLQNKCANYTPQNNKTRRNACFNTCGSDPVFKFKYDNNITD